LLSGKLYAGGEYLPADRSMDQPRAALPIDSHAGQNVVCPSTILVARAACITVSLS
jgi:hypothetical protein